jgi:peptide/nickel transport system ATP-binding protein
VDQLTQIEGSMPRLQEIPPGCPFNPRCEDVTDRCRVERPNLQPAEHSEVACHLFDGQTAEVQVNE